MSVSSDGFAAFTGEEIDIAGSGGPSTMSLNLMLHGTVGGENGNNGTFSSNAHVTVSLTGSQGQYSGFGVVGVSKSGSNPGTLAVDGLLAGFTDISGTFTTPSITVVPGDKILVDLGLSLSAGCSALAASDGCGWTVDYGHTFGFAQSGPVLNLPTGWTANSVDGSIVNNMFVAVPEPSAWALIAIPLVGMAAGRRRQA